MAELAKKHQERLPELKKWVEEGQEYFSKNVKRYEEFLRFVFVSSMTDDESAVLADTGRPDPEFNILEAMVSRLRGEFAKQQPSLSVRAADGIPTDSLTPELIQQIKIVEAHLRAVFFDGANDMLDYNIYSDSLGGGYSVASVFPKYVNEMSLEQTIEVKRAYDPTLTGFDPLARESHKGDGRWCYELYPMTKDDFIAKFGEEKALNLKFTKSLGGFNWSFKNEREEIVLVCDFYEKKKKPETICKLSNGGTLTKKEYNQLLKEWEASGFIEQPPVIVKERETVLESIVRYRICENSVLDYTETDYKFLPLVFIDGNSVNLKEGGSYTQVTRPYVYHAKGIQRLKNYAGQSLANELENTIQHKFVVAIESIPEDYLEAYQNVQKADVLMYNHFQDKNNPAITLPPPREIMRTPIPPEITNTFKISDEMTQVILGNYDQNQGMSSAPMSGVAFARSAIQTNNASVPYLVGWLKGLNRIGQIIVDLIPKVYQDPMSLPILMPNGERQYAKVNQRGAPSLNYDPYALQVKVEAGVNFAMQKEIALQTIIAMSQANKGFAEFFNQEGLQTLLDNIEIRGIDELKQKANAWMQGQKQQAAMAQQMQQKQMQIEGQKQAMEMANLQKDLQSPSQGQLGAMAIQEQSREADANLAIKAQDSQTKYLDVLSKIRNSGIEMQLKAAEIAAENSRSAVEAAVKLGDHINSTLERKENNGQEQR